jgi:hypothetical protein
MVWKYLFGPEEDETPQAQPEKGSFWGSDKGDVKGATTDTTFVQAPVAPLSIATLTSDNGTPSVEMKKSTDSASGDLSALFIDGNTETDSANPVKDSNPDLDLVLNEHIAAPIEPMEPIKLDLVTNPEPAVDQPLFSAERNMEYMGKDEDDEKKKEDVVTDMAVIKVDEPEVEESTVFTAAEHLVSGNMEMLKAAQEYLARVTEVHENTVSANERRQATLAEISSKQENEKHDLVEKNQAAERALHEKHTQELATAKAMAETAATRAKTLESTLREAQAAVKALEDQGTFLRTLDQKAGLITDEIEHGKDSLAA